MDILNILQAFLFYFILFSKDFFLKHTKKTLLNWNEKEKKWE